MVADSQSTLTSFSIVKTNLVRSCAALNHALRPILAATSSIHGQGHHHPGVPDAGDADAIRSASDQTSSCLSEFIRGIEANEAAAVQGMRLARELARRRRGEVGQEEDGDGAEDEDGGRGGESRSGSRVNVRRLGGFRLLLSGYLEAVVSH